jgi:hypothetical protein
VPINTNVACDHLGPSRVGLFLHAGRARRTRPTDRPSLSRGHIIAAPDVITVKFERPSKEPPHHTRTHKSSSEPAPRDAQNGCSLMWAQRQLTVVVLCRFREADTSVCGWLTGGLGRWGRHVCARSSRAASALFFEHSSAAASQLPPHSFGSVSSCQDDRFAARDERGPMTSSVASIAHDRELCARPTPTPPSAIQSVARPSCPSRPARVAWRRRADQRAPARRLSIRGQSIVVAWAPQQWANHVCHLYVCACVGAVLATLRCDCFQSAIFVLGRVSAKTGAEPPYACGPCAPIWPSGRRRRTAMPASSCADLCDC